MLRVSACCRSWMWRADTEKARRHGSPGHVQSLWHSSRSRSPRTASKRPAASRGRDALCQRALGFVIGAVGRMKDVKDPLNLVRVFVELAHSVPEQRHRLRLAYIGEGPLREQCTRELQRAAMADQAWLPGERSDVAELMRAMDIFVLPSLAEGSMEAMASSYQRVYDAFLCGASPAPVAATAERT
jgi:glycosyltransferase involved in cell wall biosynthesis